jgi:lysophospholipase L1-like esterase
MVISPRERILFTGDSITDANRNREDPGDLGRGYVPLIAAKLRARMASSSLQILNRGIGGNRTGDLLARVDADLLALRPTLVSVLIGVNDTWRRYGTRDSQETTDPATFERRYRSFLERAMELPELKLVLLEPFILYVSEVRPAWREDFDPKIDVVRKLAVEFGAEFIPLDGIFAEAATRAPAAHWIPDGVHPGPAGNALIADEWLRRCQFAES